MRFENRVVIVAGGAAGIGAATALRLGKEGAHVAIGDVNFAGAQEIAAQITQCGGIAKALEYDQGKEASVMNLIATTAELFGGVDCYFGNAAAMHLPREGDFDVMTMNVDIWEETMRTNLTNHAVATREVIPHMLKRGGGSLVYTASDLGVIALPKPSAYPCAKSGLGALTRHICYNHGKKGIRVNCVSPGLIVTDRIEKVMADMEARGEDVTNGQKDLVNYPRLGKPEDVAAVVCFLLSEDAAYVNGQTISVNGGSYFRL